ncbi:MAG: NADH-quinone oxidoreductase subunit J [Xanthomonadaceae bacterium]|jgi:NADH-quinone oxidoreductase subunit J|nr:NADH-quinone oxidoreductase subunit J [Xanthomonadaceae bacterium]
MELIAFYLFAAMAVTSALGVILLKNPVHAVLCLVLTFFSTACLFLLLQAEFLGVALVLVYVGAVMVLFLFVVMMLDINTVPLREGFARYLPAAAVVSGLMFVQMLVLLGVTTGKRDVAFPVADPAAAAGTSKLEWIGRALFSGYLLPFEIAAVLLTVAILAAVMLTLRRRPGARHQDPAKQSAVRKEDRVRVLKMAPEVRREEGAE